MDHINSQLLQSKTLVTVAVTSKALSECGLNIFGDEKTLGEYDLSSPLEIDRLYFEMCN